MAAAAKKKRNGVPRATTVPKGGAGYPGAEGVRP
jgi:hypothetical protein